MEDSQRQTAGGQGFSRDSIRQSADLQLSEVELVSMQKLLEEERAENAELKVGATSQQRAGVLWLADSQSGKVACPKFPLSLCAC